MKSNMLKTGIAIIIAIACSYNVFCNADALQNPSSIKSPSQVQLGGENNAFCNADALQNPSSIKSPSQVQLGGENNAFCNADALQNPSSNINQRVNPLADKKDNIQNSDSGWVQKDGYLENALQVGSISYFRYSNDGQYLFTFSEDNTSGSGYPYGNDYTFRKWDVKTGKVVKEKWFGFHIDSNFDFDIDNDENTMILSYAGGGSPRNSETYVYVNDEVIDTINSSEWFWPGERGNIGRAYTNFFNNENKVIIALAVGEEHHGGAGSWQSYAIWNLDSNTLEKTLPFYNATPYELIVSRNDKYIAVSSYYYDYYFNESEYNSSLFIADIKTDSVTSIQNFDDDFVFLGLAFSNNLKYFAATRSEQYLLMWDIEKRKIIYKINRPDLIYNKFSIDDRFLITTISNSDNILIKFYLAETGIEADSIKGSIGIIAVSPDSITIAIGGLDGRIRLYQPKIFNKQFFASFTSDTLIKQLGEPIYFTDNSFNNPTSWHWDFGDGTTSTEQHPVHYYQTKGLFSVKLIASNGFLKDTLTRKDFIRIQIPVVANFDSNITQDTVPLNVQFINQSQGDIKNYSWNFGYNKISNEENPSILYDKWGEFDVSLKVTDGYFSDSILVSEKIKVIPPAIPFFTNKLEKRFVQNNQSYYGIDGLQTFDGNFAFIAKIYNVETYYYDDEYHYKEIYRNKMLIKMDSVGNVIWEKIVTKGKKIAQLLDSCLIIVDDSVTSRNEIYVAKYNQDGEFLWERFHRTQTLRSDSPVNIKVTKDSGYVIAADSKYYDEYRSSIFKTNKNGIQTMYKANLNGRYTDVIEIEDGYYFLIYHNPNNKNIMISKINNSGKVLASVICGDKNNIFPKNTILTQKSNLIIAGWLTNTDNMQYSYMLKVDSLGNKLWDLIGTTPNSCYYYISSIADTLFAASGNFNNQLGVDIINNQGELVNSVRFPERNGVINSIITTKDNDLFLTGSITPPYKFSQLYTLLLKHPYIITSVEDEHTENTANPELPFSIFPNPTNSTATLQYKIETPTNVKIELIDFMGLKVSELENTYKEAGEYNSLINFEKLTIAKGIYFVRFIANGNVFICKLVYV